MRSRSARRCRSEDKPVRCLVFSTVFSEGQQRTQLCRSPSVLSEIAIRFSTHVFSAENPHVLSESLSMGRWPLNWLECSASSERFSERSWTRRIIASAGTVVVDRTSHIPQVLLTTILSVTTDMTQISTWTQLDFIFAPGDVSSGVKASSSDGKGINGRRRIENERVKAKG